MRLAPAIGSPGSSVVGCALLVAAAFAFAACNVPGREDHIVEWTGDGPCPDAWPDTPAPTDVVIAIDTSRSTRDPSGADIDGDGEIGVFRRSRWTDRGDSMLAAQVAAVRRLVRESPGRDVRFAIVAYSGREGRVFEDSVGQLVDRRDALLRSELTTDVAALEAELDRVLLRGSRGNSSFTPPMQLALRALRYPPDGESAERQRILFLSDSPWPIRSAPGGHYGWQDRRMRIQAIRAIKAQVAFDTFGLGRAAIATTPHTLTHIAAATGGAFYAVHDPTRLHCSLLSALNQPRHYRVSR